jgi:hypothetical protein
MYRILKTSTSSSKIFLLVFICLVLPSRWREEENKNTTGSDTRALRSLANLGVYVPADI